jgi:hypothetical protein
MKNDAKGKTAWTVSLLEILRAGEIVSIRSEQGKEGLWKGFVASMGTKEDGKPEYARRSASSLLQ